MMEIIIVALVVLWSIFAIKNSRRHSCCGHCAQCAVKCRDKEK